MSRFFSKILNYFFPTRANAYHPGIFHKESVIAIAAVLLFLQLGYFAFVTVVLHRTSFLAAVLPGLLTSMTNADRAANNAGALMENATLDKAAQLKADDMAAKGYFSHVTPDGKTPWYWLDQAGYAYTYAGENLAVDFSDSKDVEEAWMKSPTHRANIVKKEFTQIGIAVANGKYKGHDATFVVQFFGTPAKQTVATATKAPPPPAGKVLGAETGPDTSVLASAAASPNRTLMVVTAIVLGIIALLLILAIFVRIRIQYLSVIFGGLVLLAIAGGSLFMSETRVSNPNVELPTDTNSATVFIGFSS
jgi:hypothetical protein